MVKKYDKNKTKQTCRNCHDCWYCNEYKEYKAGEIDIDEDMSDCKAWRFEEEYRHGR